MKILQRIREIDNPMSTITLILFILTMVSSALAPQYSYADDEPPGVFAPATEEDPGPVTPSPSAEDPFCVENNLTEWYNCLLSGGVTLICWLGLGGDNFVAYLVCGGLSYEFIRCCL